MQAAEALNRNSIKPNSPPLPEDCPAGDSLRGKPLRGHFVNVDPNCGELLGPLGLEVVERRMDHVAELITPAKPRPSDRTHQRTTRFSVPGRSVLGHDDSVMARTGRTLVSPCPTALLFLACVAKLPAPLRPRQPSPMSTQTPKRLLGHSQPSKSPTPMTCVACTQSGCLLRLAGGWCATAPIQKPSSHN